MCVLILESRLKDQPELGHEGDGGRGKTMAVEPQKGTYGFPLEVAQTVSTHFPLTKCDVIGAD